MIHGEYRRREYNNCMAKPGLHLSYNCDRCKTPFRQSRSDQRYCSKSCGILSWYAAIKMKKHTETKCGRCENLFTPKSSVNAYCSSRCRVMAELASRRVRNAGGVGKGGRNKGKWLVPRKACEACGTLFYAPPSGLKRGQHRFCSNGCRTRDFSMHPERYPQIGSKRGNTGKRPDLGNQFFRSSWEANYARYLNWLIGIGEIQSWAYETETYEFVGIKRGTRFYTPDFIIINKLGDTERHELKGYMDQRSRTKLARMAKYYPDIKITLIDKKQYYALAKQVSKCIPNWERGRIR